MIDLQQAKCQVKKQVETDRNKWMIKKVTMSTERKNKRKKDNLRTRHVTWSS